ncbi:serine/threonine-protein kinase [Aeromicrobium sp.]|uniref:serine/threonine-protein kinase n=1 Tax=Aeromicrobium sp. TaxID=1871063 RepID=UPI0030C3180A
MLADRYEVRHEIGRGGMGMVWLGHDSVLGRTVAIKQIGMVAGGGAPDLDRAEREARLAARVNHQNVVAVYDLVFDDGHQWLVMEYVDGPTLAGLIAERGALGIEDVAPVVEQVAGALAAAHEHGIVHRDVKPSNILLTREGIAKLSDFGIARAHADAALTQTGLVTGSAAYLSPEIVTGRTASAASDVWSLGATVFHALAGRPPYEAGENLIGAMYRIVHDEPPRLEGGGRLAPLVEAMMQRDPEDRPTMAEVEGAFTESPLSPLPLATAAADLALEATQGFTPFTDHAEPAPTAAFAPMETPAAPTRPVRTPAGGRRDTGPRDRNSRRLWLAGAAAAAIIAVVAFALGAGGEDPATDAPRAGSDASQPTSAPPDQEATAKILEGFAADYLTAASNDPDAGFAMLTPDYQQESGGIEGYRGFWSGVSDLDVKTLQGDPETLTVSYTYEYEYQGERRAEDVTLQLEESDESFLIAGTA